jgi:hypothetical protein
MTLNKMRELFHKSVVFFISLALFHSCEKIEMPTKYDGSGYLKLICLWDSLGQLTPIRNGKVIITSEYGMKIVYLNEDGCVEIPNLPESIYNASVHGIHPTDKNISLIGVKKDIEVKSMVKTIDTIIASPTSRFGIVINEIYSSGPVNDIFYIFDQFIELYNPTDSIKYLDGIIVMRVSGNNEGLGPGADEGNDGDIDGITYIYKFPGNPGEKNYPIYPKQFVVIASKAIDHRKFVSTSIDLSNADWEFYNQYSPNDVDNPNVPNLINLRPDRTSDFLLALTSDIVVIATGEDIKWEDGIDINTIIDGVEYQSSPHPINKKTLDPRVDRGYVLSPPRYSGKSMQRKSPGFDTNDSSIDFEIIDKPTPGRQ